MFEQELEMEKRQSSVVPLLMIVTLILTIVAVSGYFLLESRKVLSMQEATDIANAALKSQGPAILHFHTGMVKASVDEKPQDPHYRLLEKAGILALGKNTGTYGTITPVKLTPVGDKLLAEVPGITKVQEKDGTDSYSVPIAERKVVEVSKVTMINPTHAVVEFAWKWDPNKLGNLFDASGSMVKGFNTWDRSTLIQKYAANFYHGDATRVSLSLVKGDNGWQIATE